MRDITNTSSPEVLTLQDLVHRLTLRSMADASPRNTALFVRAIQDAIRNLPGKNAWTYYNRRARLKTSPAVSCTAAYDHTGGAYERLLTITSAHTWPSDTVLGKIAIGTKTYQVQARISATQITLSADPDLVADFSGDTWWQRSDYSFTRGIARVHSVCIAGRELHPLLLSEYSNLYERGGSQYFTLRNSSSGFGTTDLSLHPCSLLAESVNVVVDVNPLSPRVVSESGTGGGVTGDAVTVAGANFKQNLIGSVFRIGRDSTAPIGFDSDNYDFQSIIMSVPSATTLKLSDAIPAAVSARGYLISSPIDIDTASMLEYLEDEAYSQYTKNHDHKSQAVSKQLAMSSLREAIARDNSRVSTRSNTWYEGFFSVSTYTEE